MTEEKKKSLMRMEEEKVKRIRSYLRVEYSEAEKAGEASARGAGLAAAEPGGHRRVLTACVVANRPVIKRRKRG